MQTDHFVVFTVLLRAMQGVLARYLGKVLSGLHEEWWRVHVLDCLTDRQKEHVQAQRIDEIDGLDLAALLTVFDRNWREITANKFISPEVRTRINQLKAIRNRWAHAPGNLPSARDRYTDIDAMVRLADDLNAPEDVRDTLRRAQNTTATEMTGGHALAPEAATPRHRGRPTGVGNKPVRQPESDHPVNLLRQVRTWSDYVKALHEADQWWKDHTDGNFSVFGERMGWIKLIREASPLTRLESWANLTRIQGSLLMGHEWEHMLLGTMSQAGKATNVFLDPQPDNLIVREEIRREIRRAVNAVDAEFPRVAADVVARIKSIHRFGGAIATRLLAIARPDRAVSVNNSSKACLSDVARIPRTVITSLNSGGKAENYRRLLEWVEKQPWHNASEPSQPREREIWRYRAALIDAFAYQRSQAKSR